MISADNSDDEHLLDTILKVSSSIEPSKPRILPSKAEFFAQPFNPDYLERHRLFWDQTPNDSDVANLLLQYPDLDKSGKPRNFSQFFFGT